MCRRKGDPPRPCGKKKLTERKAHGVVEKARRSGAEHRQEQRVYYCKGCQAHHTTSTPFTTAAERRQQHRP
jgi:hypothetical protein